MRLMVEDIGRRGKRILGRGEEIGRRDGMGEEEDRSEEEEKNRKIEQKKRRWERRLVGKERKRRRTEGKGEYSIRYNNSI